MLTRTVYQALKIVIADAGIVDVSSAFDIKNRQQLVLNVDIPSDAFTVAGFLGQFPAKARMVFMLNIVLRAFDRISERIMGLHDFVEAERIAGILIVGMVALSKITKYPVYRFRVGVRADFQDFIIVDETKGLHNVTVQVRTIGVNYGH